MTTARTPVARLNDPADDEDDDDRARRFGEALARARQARGISQTQLGRLLGRTNQSTISGWELGVAEPSPQVVFAIEDVLRLDRGFLSQHLGYVPTPPEYVPVPRDAGAKTAKTAKRASPTHDVVQAIMSDPALDAFAREMLLAMYNRARIILEEESEAAHRPRPRRRQPPARRRGGPVAE